MLTEPLSKGGATRIAREKPRILRNATWRRRLGVAPTPRGAWILLGAASSRTEGEPPGRERDYLANQGKIALTRSPIASASPLAKRLGSSSTAMATALSLKVGSGGSTG